MVYIGIIPAPGWSLRTRPLSPSLPLVFQWALSSHGDPNIYIYIYIYPLQGCGPLSLWVLHSEPELS